MYKIILNIVSIKISINKLNYKLRTSKSIISINKLSKKTIQSSVKSIPLTFSIQMSSSSISYYSSSSSSSQSSSSSASLPQISIGLHPACLFPIDFSPSIYPSVSSLTAEAWRLSGWGPSPALGLYLLPYCAEVLPEQIRAGDSVVALPEAEAQKYFEAGQQLVQKTRARFEYDMFDSPFQQLLDCYSEQQIQHMKYPKLAHGPRVALGLEKGRDEEWYGWKGEMERMEVDEMAGEVKKEEWGEEKKGRRERKKMQQMILIESSGEEDWGMGEMKNEQKSEKWGVDMKGPRKARRAPQVVTVTEVNEIRTVREKSKSRANSRKQNVRWILFLFFGKVSIVSKVATKSGRKKKINKSKPSGLSSRVFK